jgi:hypothetical protein
MHEIELKYGRVARQANDIEVRVTAVESNLNNQSDIPLQINDSRSALNTVTVLDSSKKELKMSDMLNDFTNNEDALNFGDFGDDEPSGRYGQQFDSDGEQDIMEHNELGELGDHGGIEELDDHGDIDEHVEEVLEEEKVSIYKELTKIVKTHELIIDDEVDDSNQLGIYKERAIKGIQDFEQYQKAHPMIDQRTPEEDIGEWLLTVSNAVSISEIQLLKETIFDLAGYDIIMDTEVDDDEEDEELDSFEQFPSAQQPSGGDIFSGIQVAGDGDDNQSSNDEEDAKSEEYNSGNDYDDDFEF